MKKIFMLLLLFVVTGCASITGERLQPVSVQTVQDDKEVAGVGCTLTNDEGRWFVITPGSVTIHKSTGDLSVDCKKDGNIAGHETLVSKSNGGAWGNILAGGPIGYVVDRNTGAGFNYPNNITVILRKIGEAVGVTSAIENPKNQVNQPNQTNAASTASIAQTSVNASVSQKLRELQRLRKDDLISEEEFNSKKQQLLNML